MITQAIKRWLHKIFGWLSGQRTAETEYARVGSPLNTNMTQEPISRPTVDSTPPSSGVAPLIVGQAEISCSTLDEWSERTTQPPPVEKNELPPTPPVMPSVPPADTSVTSSAVTAQEISPGKPEKTFPAAPPPDPTPEQHLEFLSYLVKRGIVNEGFAEDQVPEQYKKLR